MSAEQLPLPGFPDLIAAAKTRLRGVQPRRPGGVSPALLIRRKFRRRWSDLEMLVLLEIGVGTVSYTDLVERTGGSTSGVWNCLQNHLIPEDLVTAEKSAGRTLYRLSATGQTELYQVLR